MPAPWLNPEWKPSISARATIVFVHGAVVNGWEMTLLRHRIAQLGYRTRQFHYHSMIRGLNDNARRLKEFLDRTEGDTLHVVGHSMGGVLLREVFEQMPDPRPGRLIAIGSPLLDCWIGHRVCRLHTMGHCLLGHTVHQHILRNSSGPWRGTRDFGVIAGTYPFGIGSIFPDLPSPSDGVVLLNETRLEGIHDHVVYRLNHFGMLLSKRCAMQVARFLALGSFYHPAPDTVPCPVEKIPGFAPAS